MYLLDSSVAIELMSAGKRSETALNAIGDKHVSICPFTIHEVLFGLENASDEYLNFVNNIEILNYDKESSEISSKLDKEMSKQGNKLGLIDMLIASVAIRNNLTLVTFDKDFSRIKGLAVKFLA